MNAIKTTINYKFANMTKLYRRSGKKRLLLFSVFMNLLVNFYTFYIVAILLVLYVLARSAAAWSKDRTRAVLKAELVLDLKAAGACAVGALLCAFSLFPTIYAYLQNPRIGGISGYSASALQYDAQFYRDVFASIFII